MPEDLGAFLGLVVVPATTLAAAMITATGSVLTAAVWANVINDALQQTVAEQQHTRAVLEQSIPRPKFF